MIKDLDGIGVPGTRALTISVDEERVLTAAVRESVRRQVTALLRLRGIPVTDALACPMCGDRVILLDEPSSFVFDRATKERICPACAAERDFNAMVRPTADIGGEGA